MTGQSPAELAEQAAEAIRALSHATLFTAPEAPGYVWPSDVDSVVGSLTALAQRLQQTIRQARQFLDDQERAGRIGDDRGGDPGLVVMQAHYDLLDAESAAGSLATVLDRARQATARLTSTGGE